MKEKTLIVLCGNARGGEETWNTMYENLLEPYSADLALLFGETDEKSSSLFKKAKYTWFLKEYKDWGNYYKKASKTDNWKTLAEKNLERGTMGGIKGYQGSGAIIFAFRDFLKTKRNIIENYDRVIFTRSDHYYIDKHPVLNNNHIWIVEGEDYGGITDRHHIFPSSMLEKMIDVVGFMDSQKMLEHLENRLENSINPEIFLKLMFTHNGIWEKIKRFKRVQFTVRAKGDTTRWAGGNLEFKNNLIIKYESEYYQALRNLSKEEINMENKQKLILVLGTGRSGTTFMGRILQSHPEIKTNIEIEPVFGLITECALYANKKQELLPKIIKEYDKTLYDVKPLHHADKSHPVMWIIEDIEEHFPNALFIIMKRKPYGVIASMLKHKWVKKWFKNYKKFPIPNNFLGITKSNQNDYEKYNFLEKCTMRWISHNNKIKDISKKYSSKSIIIQYENLLKDDKKELLKLKDFLGLKQKFPDQNTNKDPLTKWKTQLSKEDIKKIDHLVQKYKNVSFE